MFFELDEKQKAFQRKVRDVYEKEVSPLVEEYERKETFPVSLYPTLGAERLLCLRCPEKYGGPGLDKVSECISMEELNRICAGIGAGIMVHGGLATDPLLHYGSEDLKQRYLPPAAWHILGIICLAVINSPPKALFSNDLSSASSCGHDSNDQRRPPRPWRTSPSGPSLLYWLTHSQTACFDTPSIFATSSA